MRVLDKDKTFSEKKKKKKSFGQRQIYVSENMNS